MTWYGTNLNLLEAIKINFAAVGTNFDGMAVWTNKDAAIAGTLPVTTVATRLDGSYTIGTVDGIVARSIYDMYYVRAYTYDGENYQFGPVRADSVASYATRLLEKETSPDYTVSFAKSMLVYSKCAEAYLKTLK
jgi:hypothetical protein